MVYVLIFAFFVYLEFSLLTLMIYGSINNNHFSWKTAVKKTLFKTRKLFGPQMILFILYILAIIPISNLGLNSIILEKIHIPDFLIAEGTKTGLGFILISSAYIILIYINYRLFFLLPLVASNNNSLFKNSLLSLKITKIEKLRVPLTFLTIGILLFGMYLITGFLITIIFNIIDPQAKNMILTLIFTTIIKVLKLMFILFTKIAMVTAIVVIIEKNKAFADDIVNHTPEDSFKTKTRIFWGIIILIGYIIYNGLLITNNELNESVYAISHRGDVTNAVENSLEALENANKKGADFVEMDIVLTKDNKFVVSHDFNLKRLGNKNSYIRNLNLNEIDGVKTRQNGFESEFISFDKYAKKAKELGQKLLVEVKMYGKEPSNMANIVADKFKELGIEKDCMVVSFDLKLMEEVKKILPELKTGYIMPLLLGDLPDTNVDFYALEDFSYNEKIAIQAKIKKKKLLIWTVNDIIKIRKYLRQPVDGIITDELEELKEEKKYLKENNTYFDKYIRIITNV